MILFPKIDYRFTLLLLIYFTAGTLLVYTYLPVHWVEQSELSIGVDWQRTYQPASLMLLNGESPYTIQTYFNPPWALLPLLPFALLSPALGSATIFVINIMAYIYTAIKLRMNILLIIVFVTFSGMLLNSINGNIEGLLSLGFILPPPIGIILLAIKPQLGLAVVIFLIVESFRQGGIKQTMKSILPAVTIFILSYILFGSYMQNSTRVLDAWWNTSIFPAGIPIGVILLILSLWKHEIRFAIAASPFFSPYVTAHTWAVVWLGLLSIVPLYAQKQIR